MSTYWSKKEEGKLRRLWSKATKEEISKVFSDRSWCAIKSKANLLGLKRLVFPKDLNADTAKWKEATRFYKDRWLKSEKEDTRTEIILDRMKKVVSILPPIPVRTTKPMKKKYDTEEVVLQVSDHQIGQHTTREETGFPPYNIKIYKQRLNFLRDTFLTITDIHRRAMNIRKLHIFSCGDIVDNEIIFKQQPFEIETDVLEQFFLGVDCLSSFLLELAPYFDEIKTYWVSGNHGRIGMPGEHKWKVNWDYLLARFVAEKIKNQKNIEMVIPKRWWKIANVMGWNFLIAHGEDIRRYLRFPYYDTENFYKDWQLLARTLGKRFEYLCIGHFHVPAEMDMSSIGEYIINGAFTGTNWMALKRMRAVARPTQRMWFVHPRIGITSRYKIRLDMAKKMK